MSTKWQKKVFKNIQKNHGTTNSMKKYEFKFQTIKAHFQESSELMTSQQFKTSQLTQLMLTQL